MGEKSQDLGLWNGKNEYIVLLDSSFNTDYLWALWQLKTSKQTAPKKKKQQPNEKHFFHYRQLTYFYLSKITLWNSDKQ